MVNNNLLNENSKVETQNNIDWLLILKCGETVIPIGDAFISFLHLFHFYTTDVSKLNLANFIVNILNN